MKTAMRALAGAVAGSLFSFILVVAVELFSAVVHPLPQDFAGTKEEMCQHVERYPQWVLAVVVPGWTFTAFVGAWAAGKIGNLFSFALVGLLLLAALVVNISMLPYPLWFKVINLVAVPLAIVGAGLSTRNRTSQRQGGGDSVE